MAKTKEELNAIKEEIETLNKKLHELTEEELAQVTGGVLPGYIKPDIERSGVELVDPLIDQQSLSERSAL